MQCIKDQKHIGELRAIYRYCDLDHEEIVRWCPNCGAIVVDADVDGRTSPGRISKMRFPKQLITANKINQLADAIEGILDIGDNDGWHDSEEYHKLIQKFRGILNV